MDALQQQAMRLSLRDGLHRENACEHELSIERLHADPAAPFCMDCEIEIKEKVRGR